MPIRSLALTAVAAVAIMTGCGGAKAPAKQYKLKGEVVSVNTKDHTVTVKHGPIAGWMDAMTMEYPVQSASELRDLHPGDQIEATVNVRSDTEYDLTNAHKVGPAK